MTQDSSDLTGQFLVTQDSFFFEKEWKLWQTFSQISYQIPSSDLNFYKEHVAGVAVEVCEAANRASNCTISGHKCKSEPDLTYDGVINFWNLKPGQRFVFCLRWSNRYLWNKNTNRSNIWPRSSVTWWNTF